MERSFADAKQLFDHRYARFHGLVKVAWQGLLAATVQNIKTTTLVLTKAPKPRPARGTSVQFRPLMGSVQTAAVCPKQKPAEKIDGFTV